MFREFEPYYTKSWDLDPFLEEFSSVTDGDSREGENEEADVDAQKGVIVGTIPCPMDRSGIEKVIHQDDGECEGEEIVGNEVVGDGTEESIDEGIKENREIVAKEPIVYQRRWFRSQGEQVGIP